MPLSTFFHEKRIVADPFLYKRILFENRIDKGLGVELGEIVYLFPDAHEHDGKLSFGRDRKDDSPFRRSVHFVQNYAVDVDYFVKFFLLLYSKHGKA